MIFLIILTNRNCGQNDYFWTKLVLRIKFFLFIYLFAHAGLFASQMYFCTFEFSFDILIFKYACITITADILCYMNILHMHTVL